MREQSTEPLSESRPSWEDVEAFARQSSRPASCTSTGCDSEPRRRWLPPEPSAGPASGCGWQGVTDEGAAVHGEHPAGGPRRPARASSPHALARRDSRHGLGIWRRPEIHDGPGRVLADTFRLAGAGADDQRLCPFPRHRGWRRHPLHPREGEGAGPDPNHHHPWMARLLRGDAPPDPVADRPGQS
jgi:hypothetical protein